MEFKETLVAIADIVKLECSLLGIPFDYELRPFDKGEPGYPGCVTVINFQSESDMNLYRIAGEVSDVIEGRYAEFRVKKWI